MTENNLGRHDQKFFRRLSRKRRLTRRFDLLTGALALVILLAVGTAYGGDCGISTPNPGGFALWFLLFLSYIPLAMLSFLDWWVSGDLFQMVSSLIGNDQAVLLGVFNLISLLLVWACVRILAARKYGENLLNITGNFLLVFLVWGCFQLCCSLSVLMWESGGISAFHSGLKAKK